MEETQKIQDKKTNTKLFPIYKMFSWDLLFYYSIIYLFLTQAKNFSASEVLLAESFFTASCLLLQIPIGLLVDKFGKKNSLVFANICMCVFITILLFINNYKMLLLANFIDAIGYVIKGVCETNILYDSLPKGEKRGTLYSSIDGVGAARYYVIDAITSIIAGITFAIDPYIPVVLCLIVNIIALILSTRFKHIQSQREEYLKETARQYFKELREAIKFTFNSKRMLCLMLFFGLMSGLTYNLSTYRSNILNSINIPAQYFGVIFAIIQIMAGICSKGQGWLHKRFKNNTLSVLGIPYVASCFIIGCLVDSFGEGVSNIVVILFILQGAIKGAYNVLIYRYLNNFTNRKIRVKLATIRNMFFNMISILISLLGSFLLKVTTSGNTFLIVGGICTVCMVLLLDYMRGKVGLKPEKYNKEDLKYSSLNEGGNLK